MKHTSDAVNRVAVDSHDTGSRKVDDGRQDGSNNEEPASAKAVDERKHDAGSREEDDILNDGRRKRNIASLTQVSNLRLEL